MGWVLVFLIGSTTVASPIVIPMATEQLCVAAKTKLLEANKQHGTINFAAYSECLRVK